MALTGFGYGMQRFAAGRGWLAEKWRAAVAVNFSISRHVAQSDPTSRRNAIQKIDDIIARPVVGDPV